MFIGNEKILKSIWIFYILGILSLIGLLLFANPINNAKCWFEIPGIGSIQPSEFMKIIIIIVLSKVLFNFHKKTSNPNIKDEFILILKVGGIVLLPAILTFLQPDTGAILIYLIITIIMLLVSGIRIRWFFLFGGILLFLIIIILFFYFFKEDLFINILGTDFFYRINRLLDWQSGEGMQYNNAIMAIGSAGLFGHGYFHTPIYFPEPQTDFIFACLASNFGLIGSILFIGLLILFDLKIINIGNKSNNIVNKYIIAGIMGMLIYQQIQNIGMTLGLLPITGITLPFISYGGSSLLSYMLIAGIIFNISNEVLKKK